MKKSVNSLYESRKFIRIILMLLSLVISITTLYLSQLLVVKIAFPCLSRINESRSKVFKVSSSRSGSDEGFDGFSTSLCLNQAMG